MTMPHVTNEVLASRLERIATYTPDADEFDACRLAAKRLRAAEEVARRIEHRSISFKHERTSAIQKLRGTGDEYSE